MIPKYSRHESRLSVWKDPVTQQEILVSHTSGPKDYTLSPTTGRKFRILNELQKGEQK